MELCVYILIGAFKYEFVGRKIIMNPRDLAFEEQLRDLGAYTINLWFPEARAIPFNLEKDEKLLGVVFGRYKLRHSVSSSAIGRGALVATNRRIFLIDKKPMFTALDAIKYDEVRAVNFTKVSISGTVRLSMDVGDISVRTFNPKCAQIFVDAVNKVLFTKKPKTGF